MNIRLWGTMVIFLVIAVLSIALIFQPVKIHVAVNGREQAVAPSAIDATGLILRAEAWKEYPTYNAGLGVIAAIAFSGAIYTGSMIRIEGEDEKKAG